MFGNYINLLYLCGVYRTIYTKKAMETMIKNTEKNLKNHRAMKKNVLTSVLSLAFCFLAVGDFWANNVRITSQPKLVSRDEPAAGFVTIQFGLAWENSWKANRPKNYDAVWVYVKCWNGTEWRHAYLHNDSTKHHFGTPATPQKVLGEDEMGTETQEELARLMVIECGKSQVQMIGEDVNEPRVTGTTGVFIYRKGNGRGTINLSSVNLLWNYANQGFFTDDELAVKVFAVEMVYIPEGDYYLGGVGSEVNGFTTNSATANTPMRITSEDAIQFANTADPKTLWTSGSGGAPVAGEIPEAFPKGWQAFYIMKYELTQEGYADFLNTLDFARQNAHTQADMNGIAVGQSPWNNAANALIAYRQGIVCKTIGDAYTFGCNLNGNTIYDERSGTLGGEDERNLDGQDIAMTFVSWYDCLAYLDFACLRPMTEMEYEKACRGPLSPVAGEYAWGNVFLKLVNERWNNTNGGYTTYRFIQNPNTGTERFPTLYNATGIYSMAGTWWSNCSGSGCWWWAGWWQGWNAYRYPGPSRVGAFADETTNRQAAGASYWGVMNMSDNVSESCVNVSNANGRNFDGQHGDGILQPNGDPSPVHYNNGTHYYQQNFWIPRGMNQSYYFSEATGGTSDQYTAGITGYSTMNTANGKISQRGLVSYENPWTERNTLTIRVTNNADYYSWRNYMNGVRGVRTQGVVK